MYSNEQVIEAVNNLSEKYNTLYEDFVRLHTKANVGQPLYSNAYIPYEGHTDHSFPEGQTIQTFINDNIQKIGTAAAANYGAWNNRNMITLSAMTAVPNIDTAPVNYVVLKIQTEYLDKNKDGTFFLLHAEADSHSHGQVWVWTADPVSKTLKKCLGCSSGDKASGEGQSFQKGPDNGQALILRYHHWICFNFEKEDLITDDEGFAYFAIACTNALTYISGWAIANRNTEFFWTPVINPASKRYSNIGAITYENSNYAGVGLSHQAPATTQQYYIPYNKSRELYLVFIDNTIMHKPTATIENPNWGGEAPEILIRNSVGNFSSLITYNGQPYVFKYFKLTQDFVENNTVVKQGLKLLEINLKILKSERVFHFSGIYTENA
ncbi:hypothetical protein [Breznakiella homolactica]|uniref:Uncharacterized protein n=1 Tax=Breznakiella homolactica TaxID=2798577 RepID=A0A7T8BB71_9SPIR|nr:hypothetical protein [Breznakiella homolactica]QQO10101.1 hypothetical protein JFL75_04060 [Breznakiella homolactica]